MVARRADTNGRGDGHETVPHDKLARALPGFRTPPHNIEAEQALLGAILVNNEAWRNVANFVRPEHFYEPVHGRIYAALTEKIRAGSLANHITLYTAFAEDEGLHGIEPGQYLYDITLAAETVLNAKDYGIYIVDMALKRGIIAAAEQAVNHAYDAGSDTAPAILANLDEHVRLLHLERGALAPRPKSVDWARVAHGQIPDQRWLVDRWIPLETSGVFGGRGGGGKSFLQMILMICLGTGQPFLGVEIEPAPCIGLFAEETQEQLESRAQKICRALQIDPERLLGRCDFRSMMGVNQPLFQAQRYDLNVTPTSWFTELSHDAKAMGERCYVMLDHILKLMAVNRNEPGQIFDLFGHLNQLATEIRGAICLLSHPSKGDIRAGTGPQIGGCHAMLDAPRWAWIMSSHTDEDGEEFRALIYEKPNHGKRHALKLVEGEHGVVEAAEEIDPDHPAPDKPAREKTISSHGRPSKADQTVTALREMYARLRRPIALDELTYECAGRGVVREISNERQLVDRRKTIMLHLKRNAQTVDFRGNDTFAIKP